MLEQLTELLIVLMRISTILPLLLVLTLYMGKRSVGEMPVFDFLIVITLGSVVGADIADPDISHIHTAVAIAALAIFQKVVSHYKIHNRTFGKLVTFEPTIVIRKGVILHHNLASIHYSVDNILLMLREHSIFNVDDVDLAIVEANGKLSVQKKDEKSSVTIEDMGITKKTDGLHYTVILEGEIYPDVLQKLQVDETWLKNALVEQGVDNTASVFYASINEDKQLYVSEKNIPLDLMAQTPPHQALDRRSLHVALSVVQRLYEYGKPMSQMYASTGRHGKSVRLLFGLQPLSGY